MKVTSIKTVAPITSENYENIFNVYLDENNFYYYNLIKKVDFPTDLDPEIYDNYSTNPSDTYPTISYKFYKSVVLWWVICAANGIDDPTKQPVAGTILKIIKPYYLRSVLTKINVTS